jgi:hypothetical protein
LVLYLRALHPTWQLKAVITDVMKGYGVSRAYVFKALREIDPERRKNIESGAAAFARCYRAEQRSA